MTGFFGKLPTLGDFVARGLPQGVRPVLDRWLTLNLADPARRPELWPRTGLRALVPGRSAESMALVILAGRDTSGRAFPLAACCTPVTTDQNGVDHWADAVVPALHEALDCHLDADTLQSRLAGLADPAHTEVPLLPPLMWTDQAPLPPKQVLAGLFPPPH